MTTERSEAATEKVEAAVDTERTRNRRVYVPNVDIIEKKDAIVLLADMPGTDEKTVHITLDNNVLTVKGAVAVDPCKGYTLAHAEYGVGDYERSFTLTEGIDQDQIDATVTNGVLRLVLPKAQPPKPKKIEVRAS
jgi:HSP20 family protein